MIFVSAGHYPSKPGARWNRFVEHDEAFLWMNMLVEAIAEPSVMAVPTGVLKDKVDFINNRLENGDVAVEIHFNAARDSNNNPIGRGSETLYYPNSEIGQKLAEDCQAALSEFYPPNRGAKEGWYRMNPENGPDFFLAKTKCPAVIIEPEFVHRSDVIQQHREQAVEALALILTHRSE